MNKLLNKGWKPALTILLGVAAFLFWRMRYPFALAFQEQFQLFLLDKQYLLSRIAEPGGIARYIGEFLVQFYNNVTFGALVIALLYMLLQVCMWRLMRPAHSAWYGLSFMPVLLLWALMGDENVLLNTVVALLLAMLFMLCLPKGRRTQWLYVLLGVPLFYWMIGPVVLLVALYVAFKQQRNVKGVAAGMATVAYAGACVALSSLWLPFPSMRLWLGLSYYRYVEVIPYLLVLIAVVILLLAVTGRWMKAKQEKRLWIVGTVCVLLPLLTAFLFIPRKYDKKKYDLIEYDYLVRANKWNAILEKSSKQQPDLAMSVCATNLALAMTGQLGDRAFQFYQRGSEGLLPPSHRNYATLQLTGEAYFQLGLLNTAQRFAFEAMEAIPNYNKSGRAVKRLVETNLLNGQYEVARKYLNMLKKTFFYRKWALRTEKLVGNKQAVEQHPLYGKLCAYRLEDDLLFSDGEIDKICGQLFMHNPQNNIAMQYLLMCPLLNADINKFINYVQVVQKKVNYNPRYCQEAVAYAFMKQGQQPPQGLVSPMVVEQLRNFVQIYRSEGKKSPQLQTFKNTLWYYLMGEE